MKAEIERLRAERERSRFLFGSVVAMAILFVGALVAVAADLGALLRPRRLEFVGRFLREEACPEPLRAGAPEGASLFGWAAELWRTSAAEAALATLAIATVAIGTAGLFGAGLALLGSRSLALRDPYGVSRLGEASPRGPLAFLVRALCVLARAIPEYVLAFLAIALFGVNAWPAVLALALHNAGILGRLGGEVVDHLPPAPLAGLRATGATLPQVALFGVVPAALGRWLLYFFYRFETCLREATVLGMLGIASLGALVEEARARGRYDELVFLVAVSAGLVLGADLLSAGARRWIR